MYNNYYNHYSHFASKSLFEVINKGIDLMSKNIDSNLLQAWQNYATSVLNLISNQYGLNLNIQYMQFRLSIINLSPYDQLKVSIQKLLDISKNLPPEI